MVEKVGFADCAKCYGCEVLSGDGNVCNKVGDHGGMVKDCAINNGVGVGDGKNMVKKVGFADCAKCYGCEVFSGDENVCNKVGDHGGMVKDCAINNGIGVGVGKNMVKKVGFADCAKCYGCEVFSGDGNVSNKVGDHGGMVKDCAINNGVGKNMVKKVGFADCAKCYGCEVLSGDGTVYNKVG
ncbi:hypothetical protein KSS87_012576, partial [Heliosperma pusillum]